jgi:lipid A disaccharide synthetase
MAMAEAVDVLILSNGPGELATWVKPVVQQLRQQLSENRDVLRISLVLSPCPHASGRETDIARTYPEIDRVQAPQHFFPFLLRGKTAEHWDWRSQGVVLFLGGDQFYPVVIGKRLGYRTIIYAEWEARWQRWIDRYGVMRPEIIDRAAPKYAPKFTLVGDLMAEVGIQHQNTAQNLPRPPAPLSPHPSEELLGLLPGSKATKLAQGVPFLLAIVERIHAVRPQTRFVIPVAPALPLTTLAKFANPQQNPIVHDLGGISAELVTPSEGNPFLKTINGIKINLYTQSPAYELLSQCQLCLTTVGANTAELGSLAIPMIVLLPTQRLDAVPLDGILGLLTYLPGVGTLVTKAVNWWTVRNRGLLAWPNIWAGEEIVPERVGNLEIQSIANLTLDLLDHPAKLAEIRTKLRQVRGQSGAAAKLVQIVQEELDFTPFREGGKGVQVG